MFLRAISCRGLLSLADTLAGYGETYEFTSSHGGGAPALVLVRRAAERRGLCRVLSMSPLHPERIDAVMLPPPISRSSTAHTAPAPRGT